MTHGGSHEVVAQPVLLPPSPLTPNVPGSVGQTRASAAAAGKRGAAIESILRFHEVRPMRNNPKAARILSQSQRGIKVLARETHTALATVQEVYLCEYNRLAAAAHIKSYLPLVTSNRVRAILEQADHGKMRPSKS